MLLGFFEQLRRYQVPVSLRECIDLLALMRTDLVFADQYGFYCLSRIVLVKDEKYYDRFDRAFTAYFEGIDRWAGLFVEEGSDLRREILRNLDLGKHDWDVLDDYEEEVRQVRDALLLKFSGEKDISILV